LAPKPKPRAQPEFKDTLYAAYRPLDDAEALKIFNATFSYHVGSRTWTIESSRAFVFVRKRTCDKNWRVGTNMTIFVPVAENQVMSAVSFDPEIDIGNGQMVATLDGVVFEKSLLDDRITIFIVPMCGWESWRLYEEMTRMRKAKEKEEEAKCEVVKTVS